jgi:hypothetical protein
MEDNEFKENEFSKVQVLCQQLTKAAKILGPTEEGLACIKAQHYIVKNLSINVSSGE